MTYEYGSDRSGPHDGGPPPGALTQDDRTWALLAHIGSLVTAWFAFGFIAPLVVMLVKGGSSPYVRKHAVESLNFQISVLIYSVVLGVLGVIVVLLTFGLGLLVVVPVGVALGLVVLALIIIATMKASNGESYRYPLTLRLVR